MSSCAIVILNFNGEEMLKTFLPSVCAQSSFDIWIIDNASTDSSIDFLSRSYPDISVVKLDENYGFAGGYNLGLAQVLSTYAYYILVNSDVAVSSNWDKDLISWMDSNPLYGALQPKILSWKNPDRFDYAGAGGGFLDGYGYPYCRGRIWETIEEDHGQYNDFIDVDWASGACMVVRVKVFNEMNGFDARFFAHMEEIDLCWRMRRAGWKIGYQGSVSVFHLGGATLDRASAQKLYLNIRNSLLMNFKNERRDKFRKVFLVKWILENSAALHYLMKGDKKYYSAIKSAYKDFKEMKHSLKRSAPILSGRKEITRKGKDGLVFMEWKLKGKKYYSQL
jgi:hypothetical protein